MTIVAAAEMKKYAKYVPNYDYSQVNNWSMSEEESNAIMEEAAKLLDSGDEDGFDRLAKKLPLAPNMALRMRDEKGKDALLAEGWNLADAEIVYGKNWLDEYMVDWLWMKSGNPGNYVAVADMTRAGIGSSSGEPRVAPESVAYDPVRAALTQFRKELLKELTNRKVDKHPDNRHTNMLRFMATIRAERSYLEEYLAARHTEKKEAKKKHLEDFDKRMEKLTRKIEPPQ